MFVGSRRALLGGTALVGAIALLRGESQGLAIDFTYPTSGVGSVAVRDAATPANNLSNVPAGDFLTNSGTSPKYVTDVTGTYVWTPHNLVTRSQTFDHASWVLARATISANALAAPDGTLTADKLVEDGTVTSTHNVEHSGTPAIVGETYTLSYRARAGERTKFVLSMSDGATGNAGGLFDLSDGTVAASPLGAGSWTAVSSTITDLGGGWYLCSTTATMGAGTNIKSGVFLHNGTSPTYSGDNASGLYIWGAQLNRGTVPTTYMATTTAARYAVPMEYDSGWYALVEPAATGLALWNRDLTNAAWVKTGGGGTTAAKDQVGIDGVANSASSLTADGADGTALQAITSVSAARAFAPFVKRITGTGTISITLDGGLTYTDITASINSSTFTRVTGLQTLADPTIGFKITTSGDKIAVDVAGIENGTVATSPIPVPGAAIVTRAADLLNAATSTFPLGAAYSIWAQVASSGFVTGAIVDMNDGGAQEVEVYWSSNNLLSYSSGGANLIIGAPTVNTTFKVAARCSLNDYHAALNGVLSGVPDTTVTMPVGPVTMYLGSDSGASRGNWKISKVMIVPRDWTNAELQTKTAA